MGNHDHAMYMSLALREAFAAMGTTSPNPSVGAVIVKNGEVIAKGSTSEYGGNHAEVNALRNASRDCAGAAMYVTLEPCCHFGKTPPCTDAIIQAGIKEVYIPLLDPNPLVAGKGVKALNDAGVKVVFLHDYASFALDLLRPFKKSIVRHKPYIIHKAALTLDGKTATVTGDAKWITSPYSRYIVHRLRACVDTIVIGRGTVDADNPRLNVRLDEFSQEVYEYFNERKYEVSGYCNAFLLGLVELWEKKVPSKCRKIVIGLPRTLTTTHIYADTNAYFVIPHDQISIVAKRDDYKHITSLIDCGRVLFMHSSYGPEFVYELLEMLHSQGSMIVLVEGGAVVAGMFFEAREIDQYMYFISPKILGNGKGVIEGGNTLFVDQAQQLYNITNIFLGEDTLISGYKEQYQFEAI